MNINTHKDRLSLSVDLGDRSYPIIIGAGLLDDAQLVQSYLGGEQKFVVTNDTVAPLYLKQLQQSIGDVSKLAHILPDGEQFKNLASMEQIYSELLAKKCSRDVTLVALGGGVVGDMTGFAAATYQRGVSFIQVPTTLLAQVDSSVGGKTGVNHPSGKNMIGAFYQPRAVLIDTDTLATLPEREFRAGLAEVIKYGLICDQEFLAWLATNMPKLVQRDAAALQFAIHRSCGCKAGVVAADETESGVRAILNFGHTFGHAVETATHYQQWLHGEAVGFGMLVALDFSHRSGFLSAQDFQMGSDVIHAAGLPSKAPDSIQGAQQILDLMAVDKKVKQGKLRLVLLRELGGAFVTANFDVELLEKTIQDYL